MVWNRRSMAKFYGIERKITNILDNITATNRGFADRRITERKEEPDAIMPRIQELELSSTQKLDMEGLLDALLDCMRDLETVVGQGTVDEKRHPVRAFTKRIELGPQTGNSRAQLPMLPDLAAAIRYGSPTAKSSFGMVAEEGNATGDSSKSCADKLLSYSAATYDRCHSTRSVTLSSIITQRNVTVKVLLDRKRRF